jgi:hypothetical protein
MSFPQSRIDPDEQEAFLADEVGHPGVPKGLELLSAETHQLTVPGKEPMPPR